VTFARSSTIAGLGRRLNARYTPRCFADALDSEVSHLNLGPMGRLTRRVSPMDVKEIEEKVIAIVAEQMGVDKGEINRETHFVNDLNADSLDTVELVMEFEDEFETSIPDEDAEKIQTVGQAIDFIKEHLNKAGGA
jgi:acyl carrier protein